MSPLAEPVASPPSASPLEAFAGTIHRTRTGPVYTAGLAVVAFAMVLLPLIYIGLIAFTAWGVLLHLTKDTWILEGHSGRGAFGRLIMYLGPAIVGGILVFFMVKPFFAAKAKRPAPLSLDLDKEPLLFEFVRRICSLVGAPVPCRVDVDCEVNASASLRRGLWSRDLVLTIGLPLVSGLSMRQLAGVLAHEFGHFAQGAGMRFTYVIRRVNFWFARVVYERDQWDLMLDHWSRQIDLRIGIVLHIARGCVWLTRRILWVLMQGGHAISCFMLRQMEYDADSYESKIAGSDAFEATASRLRVLNVAAQFAYNEVQQSWTSKRLPEDLPLLIRHKASTLPEEVHQKLGESRQEEKTRWFDTHPCDADRVTAARRLNEPGVFRVEEPASQLFSDYPGLSKAVTQHEYSERLELEFSEGNLIRSEDILRESQAHEEAQAMIRKYYGKVDISLKGLLAGGELPPLLPGEILFESWSRARQVSDNLREKAGEFSGQCVQQQSRVADLVGAESLLKAGFRLQSAQFGLPGGAKSIMEQLSATSAAQANARTELRRQLANLEPFTAALRSRVHSAVRLAQAEGIEPAVSNLAALLKLLAALGNHLPELQELGMRLKAFGLLADNRDNHSKPEDVDKAIAALAGEMKLMSSALHEDMRQYPYPFPHARGALNVAEYAVSERSTDNEWVSAYFNAAAHVERLFALNYELVGKILSCVNAIEARLDEMRSAR